MEVNTHSVTEREGEQEELREAHELTSNATDSADGRRRMGMAGTRLQDVGRRRRRQGRRR
jgi:hypothetical protein